VFPRIDKEADDSFFAERLGGLQPMQTLNEHETRAIRSHQNRRLLAVFKHVGSDFVHALLFERRAPFRDYSLGGETLDWYFELGDLIADEIVVRELFQIRDSADLKKAAIAVLDCLHVIETAFTDFAGYFIHACCAK
jgi:hypothetical protein